MITRGTVFQGENSIDVEPGAATLIDLSRYHNHGAITGTAPYIQLPSGLWILNPNGTNGYVAVPDIDELSFGDSVTDNPFTFKVWVYLLNDFQFSKGLLGTTIEYYFWFTPANSTVRCFNPAGTVYIGRQLADASAYANRWVQVITTYDGSSLVGGLRIYFNGVRVDDTDASLGVYTAMTNGVGDLHISRDRANYGDSPFGSIEIIRSVWSAGKVLNSFENEKHWFGVHD